MTPQPAILANDVRMSYLSGGVDLPVLEGIDLKVLPGECVFLVGPSGCGKTTLLSILGCLLTPNYGRIEIVGKDLAQLNDVQRAELRRDRIGFVFQRFQLVRGLNALQNVCVPLTLRGVPRQTAESRALELLDAVRLVDKATAHIGTLSSGQCQRVALARALAGDPDLILADEPTASLDGASGQEVMQLLVRLTSKCGKTAVVVTHDARIFGYADRVLHLEGGRIVSEIGEEGVEGSTRRAAEPQTTNAALRLASCAGEMT